MGTPTLKLIKPGTEEKKTTVPTLTQITTGNSTPTLTKIQSQPQNTPAQTPVSTPEEEPFQLRMAKASAAGEFKPKGTDLAEKRAAQAEADKEYRSSLWDFLNTMISNAGAGSAGVIASPMDAAEPLDSLQAAKEASDKAAAAFEKQGAGRRTAELLAGWGGKAFGNIGNTLLTVGKAYGEGKALADAYSTDQMLLNSMLGLDPAEEAHKVRDAINSEEAQQRWNEYRKPFDEAATQGAEYIQQAKDGQGALGRLAVDLGVGALDLAADQALNTIVPGAGMAAMATRVFGEAAREERLAGGSEAQQLLAGTKAAAVEVLTEKIAGIGGVKGVKPGFVDGLMDKALDRFVKNGGSAMLGKLVQAFGSEAAEEMISDLINPLADKALGLNNQSSVDLESLLYDGLVGGLLGMLGGFSEGRKYSREQAAARGVENMNAALDESVAREAQQTKEADVHSAEEITAQAAEITQEGEGDISVPPATGTAPTVESERLNPATKTAGEPAVPQRVPAGDFTPKRTTNWNPKSKRGQAEQKAARKLKRTTGLWSDTEAGAEAVHRVAESMRDRSRGTDVMEVARKAADEMMQRQKSGVETGDRALYNRIREYLRGKNIQISDELRGDIPDFSAWKKDVMSKLRLRANSGDAIDSVYAELSQIAGEGVFPPDVYSHSDMINNILHVLDAVKPQAAMMADEFTGEGYDAIRDAAAADLARAAAETVGGKWTGYEWGSSLGNKSEAAKRYDAIQQEIEVASWENEALSREEAARIVDERYIRYGVYDISELLNETEDIDNGTDEAGEEAEALQGNDETETERPTDAGTAEDGGTGIQPLAGRDVPPGRQAGGVTQPGREVERGLSKNVRTDENMEQSIRDDFTQDPEYYTQLTNKETLGKAQKIFAEGMDTARDTVEAALANAKAGKKLAPEIVPLARMVANELARNGEKASARRILSDLAVELTQAGQLGQAAKILRSTDAQTALKTVQKALDKINAEVERKFGKRGKKGKWRAKLTDAEIEMLENIDIGDEAAFQDAYKQIAKRIGAEMPATLWEKITELRRINMLLKPRTQIRNFASNAPMVLLRKGAETMSGAIQDEMVKLGVMDKAQQTRTLKVSKELRKAAKEYVKANKDSILSEGNKWDMNTLLRESRTYFKGGDLEKAISKMTGKEQQALLEQARRFTYKLLEKGDAPFVMSAYTDSLAQFMAARGLTDFSNIPQEVLDFASANAMEATFKNASNVANFINQIKRQGGALGKALDVVIPFTTTPANIFNLMVKYSPAGFADTISKAVKKANAPDIIDSASKATVGSAVFGLGLLLRSMGAITGKPDDDEDKRALDKATGKSPYSIAGRWSYDWAQPVGSLLVLGAETWDAIQGQEGVADAVMNAIYAAGDSALNMSLFQNVTSMLKGYGSNTEKILNAIVEGGGTQLVPGLAGDIAALIDDTVRSSYTGGNVFQNTLAKMGMNLPGISTILPESVNVKGEVNKRGPLWFRSIERFIDPGTWNKNEMTDADRAIYDLYEETNDKTIFPRVSPTKFDYGGETYRMTGEERETFQKTQGQTYYEMLDALLESDEWADLSTDAKVKLLQDAAAYSLDEAKRELVESRGGEYESNDWENLSTYADGDNKTAAQFLAVKDQAKTAIKNEDVDILDKLLGKDGAYRKLDEDAQEMLNIDHLKKIVSMNDNGLDAAGALTVVNTIADLEPVGDHKSVTQQQQVDAIIGTDLTDKEKLSAIKAYTSENYMEEMQAAVNGGLSLEKWSEVRNKYAEIKDTEGLSAMQKATRFAAALDNDKDLTEKQRQILREQLTYSSMSTAEAKRYDELTETGMSIDTATKVTDLLSSIEPLPGKTGVTQNQKVDAIINGGLKPADTWAALKVYTSDSWYNNAAAAYKKGIDLDDYVRQFREADLPNDKGETNGQLSQAELYAFYMQNPKANGTFCKVMLMILNPDKDWNKFLREQEKAAKKKAG